MGDPIAAVVRPVFYRIAIWPSTLFSINRRKRMPVSFDGNEIATQKFASRAPGLPHNLDERMPKRRKVVN
jgi:hypothetical protein